MPTATLERAKSKQDFLKECMADQGDDAAALAICTAKWKAKQLSDFVDNGRLHLAAPVELSDAAEPEQKSRFGMLAYTGKIIDLGYWGRFVIDLAGISTKPKIPILREHMRDRVVGMADDFSQTADGLMVTGDFSDATPDGREVLALAREGFPWQASIGVKARKILALDKGATHEVNGQLVEGPADVWLESDVDEVSFVALGADDDTAAIAMSQPPNLEEKKMPDQNVIEASARESAANQAAQEALEKAKLHASQEATLAERDRVVKISDRCRIAGLSAEFAKGLVGTGASESAASEAIFTELAKSQKPLGVQPAVDLVADESDKIRLAATDAFALRAGLRVEKPAVGWESFRGMSISDFARECLSRSGVQTRGLSRREIADMIIKGQRSLAASTSDFTSVFKDVSNKALQRAYQEAPQTWRPLVNTTTVSDFKTQYGIALSDGPGLDLVAELGEYKVGKLNDKQESYAVKKYGKMLSMSWEMIVNDDIRAFVRVPAILGAAAQRKESDIVWALITANASMTDGYAIFHANHANLEATTKTTVSSAALAAGRLAMRKQKGFGPDTPYLDLMPAFLLVPLEQELSAEVILRSPGSLDTQVNAGVVNPWNGRLTPIAEPRLSANSTTAWYLAASPSQIDTIEVAYLEGNQAPYITENEEFKSDAITYKVRHVFGAGVMDYRGLFKNPGA